MSKRNIFTIVIIVLMATLLVVVPASAEAITETIIYRNETMTFPDIDICGAGDVMVTITFNGVWHTTEYSDDDPNSGAFHGRFKMNGTVTTVDLSGNLVSKDRFVKTIFHTNLNNQNLTERSNFIINGTRADGGRHRYHFKYHLDVSASGNPVEFTDLRISCPR